MASQEGATRKRDGGEAARKRLANAEARLRKYQAAINPAALAEVITAQTGRAAAYSLGSLSVVEDRLSSS